MSRFAVCVPFYEAARPYFAHFAVALRRAVKPYSARVLFMVDDAHDGVDSILPLLDGVTFEVMPAPIGATPADIRSLLLRCAVSLDVDAVAFADCDDELEDDALTVHAQTLEHADFGYGDQILIDQRGDRLGTTLYDHWAVPAHAESIESLLDGNFAGFSGCAVRATSLSEEVVAVPSAVVATDWWVFSRLLLAGATGSQTRKPVVRYRQHPGNIHGGATVSHALVDVRRRAEIALAHFAHLPQHPGIVQREAAMRGLMDLLAVSPTALQTDIEKACSHNTCWYADVVSLALQHFDKHS